MKEVYQSEEDSFLMSSYLNKILSNLIQKNPNIKFLEIGSGSGIILDVAHSSKVKKENILGSDINPLAVKKCQEKGFICVLSDLFKEISKKFDIIAFNPPYLPLDNLEPLSSRTATTGGKKGNELILRFLKEAKFNLKNNGKIFLITSSLSKKINFKKEGYYFKEVDSKKLFFEKITLWELRKIYKDKKNFNKIGFNKKEDD